MGTLTSRWRHSWRRPPSTNLVARPSLRSLIFLPPERVPLRQDPRRRQIPFYAAIPPTGWQKKGGWTSLKPGAVVGGRIGLFLDARVDVDELVKNAPAQQTANEKIGSNCAGHDRRDAEPDPRASTFGQAVG